MVSGEVTGRSSGQGAELVLEDGVTITVNAQLAGRLSILAIGPGRQREHEIERCLERKVERKTKQETEVEKERGTAEPSSPGVPRVAITKGTKPC